MGDDLLLGVDPMLPTPQGVVLLDFDISAGIESIDALNDLLNWAEADDSFLPIARSNYVSERQFSASHITAFAQSAVARVRQVVMRHAQTLVMLCRCMRSKLGLSHNWAFNCTCWRRT